MRLKLLSILLIIFALLPNLSFAQTGKDKEGKAYIPDRIIMWNKIGQRENLRKCEEYLVVYADAEPENTFVRFIESKNDEEYILELATLATQSRPKPIDVTQSILIPIDGSSPIPSKQKSGGATRSIVFSKIGQKEPVGTGELVNILYENISVEKTYIAYESTEDGYLLELTSLMQQKVLDFAKRCQIFVVASPSTTTIRYSDLVKYEQIVWTPRADGSWEVRIGTTQQNCKSEAFDRIKELRTREYLNKVPIEKKNSR